MISKEEVLNLATLARLRLSDQEVEGLQKDISSILEYVETVSSVEMPQGEVLRRGQEKPAQRNVTREDMPRGEGDMFAGKEESLRAAFPKREGDFNVVRKIIQKDE